LDQNVDQLRWEKALHPVLLVALEDVGTEF
jgi:hypothetical protein